MDHVAKTPDMLAGASAGDIPGAGDSSPADHVATRLKALRVRQIEHYALSYMMADAKKTCRTYRDRVASAFRETTLMLAHTVEQLPEVDLEELLARARKGQWLPAKPAGDRYTALARLGCGPHESKSNVARIASVLRAMAERSLVADEVFGADKKFWAVHRELCVPAGKVLIVRLDAEQAAALHAAATVTIRLVRDPDNGTGCFAVAELTVDQADAAHDRETEESRAASVSSAGESPDTLQVAHRVIGTGVEEGVPLEAIASRSGTDLPEAAECGAAVSVEADRGAEPADAPARRCAVRFKVHVRRTDPAAFRLLQQHGAFQRGGIWLGCSFEGFGEILRKFDGTLVDQVETESKRNAMNAASVGHSRPIDQASRHGALQSARGGAAGNPRRSLVSSSWLDAQWGRSEVLYQRHQPLTDAQARLVTEATR